jgi:hypothetical protein
MKPKPKPTRKRKPPAPAPQTRQAKARGQYGAHKEQARARQAKISAEGRDIGPLPKVADPARRAEGLGSLRRFLEIYFPKTFRLKWSPAHLKVIERIELVVTAALLFALGMPRGWGKTQIFIRAAIWAIAKGNVRFVGLIGPDKGHAKRLLAGIRSELDSNPLLMADFPEICYPIRCIAGINNRCPGQLCAGQATHIELTKEYIALAHIPVKVLKAAGIEGPNGAGGVFYVAGMTGQVRGMFLVSPTGETIRPDLVLLDDPQTRRSAKSLTMIEDRSQIIAGDVLRLAGPDKPIAALMACTVIYAGDLSDRHLNRELHPEWHGERFKMVNAFPTNQSLWDEYAELRTASLRNGGQGEEATEFYRQHRTEMDAGADVTWPERHDPHEISALQHAMNLKLQDEASFLSECQNEPTARQGPTDEIITAEEVAAKVNGRPRGQVPAAAQILTAFVDCQKRLLYYIVCAWEPNFTGYVVDYGTYPEQAIRHFRYDQVQRTLSRAHPGHGVEGALYAGLETLIGSLAGREWTREGGAIMRLDQIFVDQGYQADTVHLFCRQSEHAATLMPSRGAGIKASQIPIAEYKRNAGDRIGFHWWIPSVKGKRVLRHIEVDTYYWKSFVHERLATALGDKGCLSIYGKKGVLHRLLGEHVTAEYRVPTQAKGRTVDEWYPLPGNPDNHWFDGLVGCAAAASLRGIELGPAGGAALLERKKISLAELQRRRKGR